MPDITIINPWKSPKYGTNRDYRLNDSQLKYTSKCGHYRIFKEFDKSFLYCYDDTAFNCLAGYNVPYMQAHEKNIRPTDSTKWLFDRANKFKTTS